MANLASKGHVSEYFCPADIVLKNPIFKSLIYISSNFYY
ncbi:unknown [[Mannheimia] succiniciproducens MBEL55E]|uniref:Uncharacterized protein n=1 Tax=Mannheimia succiniciproducens (strain KCTC 0769BP / MBEL55E) TaxID=221988 RepID=Q65TV3_MANSM|nr:unknown [[Mannheimia] succiniciproducens MBEL55E]